MEEVDLLVPIQYRNRSMGRASRDAGFCRRCVHATEVHGMYKAGKAERLVVKLRL